MSDFTITSTAECDYCGNMLSSSDEPCDECSPNRREYHLFRHMTGISTDSAAVVVDSTPEHKWQKLKDVVGDGWIAYEWLGPRESVRRLLLGQSYTTLDELPAQQTSLDVSQDL